jgi:nucleoid-associated protein YgaU
MKILKFGASGRMVQIGADPQNSEWYVITPTVENFIKTMKEGEDVTIRFEKTNGKNHLSFIQRGNGAVSSTPTGTNRVGGYTKTPYTPQATAKPDVGGAKTYGKSPAEQDTIKRQAVMHATSRSLISMQGRVNEENIFEISEKLYMHYWDLVNRPLA